MVMLSKHYHTFHNDGKTAEVWKTQNGQWATRHYENKGDGSVWIKDVVHTGKSESWAEDAAENWVFGILKW